MDANERGQYSVQRGERAAGAISFYDSDTGQLIAHIGQYTYFTSNPRWNDLPKSKHEIVWQPKFIRRRQGAPGPAARWGDRARRIDRGA